MSAAFIIIALLLGELALLIAAIFGIELANNFMQSHRQRRHL